MEQAKQDVLAYLATFAATWGLTIIGALVLGFLGIFVAGWASRAVVRASSRSSRIDRTLVPLLSRLVRWSILAVTLIAVLDLFGVQTAGIFAFLGAAGIAVGLALKDTVADVAAGVMLLVLRPFDVGDAADIGGTGGVIDAIDLFETKLTTFDGIPLVIPNGKVRGSELRNYTRAKMRRIDARFGISHSEDIGAALEVVKAVVAADARILLDPAPVVTFEKLGDSSLSLLARVWTKPGDLFQTEWDLARSVKERFDAQGISIARPQREVHVHEVKEA